MSRTIKLFYVETGRGCGLKKGKTAESVRRVTLSEVGSIDGVRLVREATERDIAWVRGMGGHVPQIA